MNKDLRQALKEVKEGAISKPFSSIKEFKKELEMWSQASAEDTEKFEKNI